MDMPVAALKRREMEPGPQRIRSFGGGDPLEEGRSGRRLRSIRRRIDRVDGRLVKLLAQRCAVAMEAAAEKTKLGKGVVNRKREQEVLSIAMGNARKLGLDPDIVKSIFTEIIRLAKACENRFLSGKHE